MAVTKTEINGRFATTSVSKSSSVLGVSASNTHRLAAGGRWQIKYENKKNENPHY